ncbi:MAG: energy transducer TonB [Bacteroidales bacterium]|nr:energy transducer TonB [Bacteroidales bacterium]
MEIKKSSKVSLEKKKFLFLEVGLVLVFAICLVAFEWTSSPDIESSKDEEPEKEYSMDQAEVVPPEQQQQQQEPPKALEQLEFKEAPKNKIIKKIDFTISDEDADSEWDFLESDDDDDESGVAEVFFIVEDMPKFNGGPSDGFRTYIAENLQYPQIAAENGISGRVYVQFTVNSNGKVVDVVVARGVDPALDKEALRVVKSSPSWTPGKQRGRPVNVRFTFPIVFVLQ